jgi:hypothetical protein
MPTGHGEIPILKARAMMDAWKAVVVTEHGPQQTVVHFVVLAGQPIEETINKINELRRTWSGASLSADILVNAMRDHGMIVLPHVEVEQDSGVQSPLINKFQAQESNAQQAPPVESPVETVEIVYDRPVRQLLDKVWGMCIDGAFTLPNQVEVREPPNGYLWEIVEGGSIKLRPYL